MIAGDKVKYTIDGRIGICHGPIFHFQVWWMLIEWDDGNQAYVLEDYLEVVE